MSLLKIGIARGLQIDVLIPAFYAAIDGGFTNLEITMNTRNASKLISAVKKEFAGKALIGAGTVTIMSELHEALSSGAEFIVSPNTDIEIIGYCKKNNIPVYPGALTPTEIYNAWISGASMVKVFPVSSMGGFQYIKELKGPFDNIKLLACGGVNSSNIEEFKSSGVDGIALGSNLFKKEWIEKKEFNKITEEALKYN
jgi:2-dehydro-3-deoxyphosphogluconate aldolase / (4S)-4-hydroxy-2-oxoglutarate aldolase